MTFYVFLSVAHVFSNTDYSANFYCNIALINSFKLYLIKTYSKTPKTKKNVNKNNVEYILRLHLVNVT